MTDSFSENCRDFLDGQYDCVDRIVLNAYFPLAQGPGGFRIWWRRLMGGDDRLDDTHLMRLAGRFARRVRAFAKTRGIPVVFCPAGTRKDEVAQTYLAQHPDVKGIFMILIGRAPGPVWQVKRNAQGVITDIGHPKSRPYVNHIYFHILDRDWGTPAHQDVCASFLQRPGPVERARVRGLPSAEEGNRLLQGAKLFHSIVQPRRPGASRRDLVRRTNHRAVAPNLRKLDLPLPLFGP